jgi:hypothetical protein
MRRISCWLSLHFPPHSKTIKSLKISRRADSFTFAKVIEGRKSLNESNRDHRAAFSISHSRARKPTQSAIIISASERTEGKKKTSDILISVIISLKKRFCLDSDDPRPVAWQKASRHFSRLDSECRSPTKNGSLSKTEGECGNWFPSITTASRRKQFFFPKCSLRRRLSGTERSHQA